MNYLSKDLIKIGVEAKNSTEIIKSLGMVLKDNGFIKDTYIDAVIAREAIYPTGLPSIGVTVAIPHTDSNHVYKSAVAIAVLKEPVGFYMMGGTGELLNARIVFLLAISNTKEQLELLKNLMRLFQNQEVLEEILNANTSEDIYQILAQII
ncbi:MAG: PTS sugar transporter subunit IIA [Lutisporaceae bacterium]